MALDKTQRNLLEETLKFLFEGIKEFIFGSEITFGKGISNDKALTALQLILTQNITPSQQIQLQIWGVWKGGVEKFRRILNHLTPQNRVVDQQDGLDEDLEGLFLELDLKDDKTIQDNETAGATKEDVIQYITQEVIRRIEAMQSQGIKPAVIEEIEENQANMMTGQTIKYLTRQTQQIAEILQDLQVIVTPAQLIEISPQTREEIIHNSDAVRTAIKNGITFGSLSSRIQNQILNNENARPFLGFDPGLIADLIKMNKEQFARATEVMNNENARLLLREDPYLIGHLAMMDEEQFARAIEVINEIVNNENVRLILRDNHNLISHLTIMDEEQFARAIEVMDNEDIILLLIDNSYLISHLITMDEERFAHTTEVINRVMHSENARNLINNFLGIHREHFSTIARTFGENDENGLYSTGASNLTLKLLGIYVQLESQIQQQWRNAPRSSVVNPSIVRDYDERVR